MKLFQQLLLAPAVLGLLAPVAANAAELNINDVATYSPNRSKKNVRINTNTQFSDVVPGDWAYTALTNISESYGCVDSTYSRSLQNGQALTRYEAAALLNSCLEGGLLASGEALNSDAVRLADEFGAEMAILKGRVDGLESQITELSAGQFSSTTKMTGRAAFVVGGVDYEKDANNTKGEAINMAYSFRIELDSSTNGEDRLYTRLLTGNMGANADGSADNPWADKAYGTYLAVANSNDETIKIDKLWYEFPVGDFRVWAGPKIENYYMLASAPSIYKPVMKQFALGGNTAAYASSTDGGFGLAWTQPKPRGERRFTVSTNYVSKGAENGTGGLLTDTNSKWLSQLTYGNSKWQLAYAYALHNCPWSTTTSRSGNECQAWSSYYSTDAGNDVGIEGEQAHSFRAYWKPSDNGVIPQLQLGFDIRNLLGNTHTVGNTVETRAWMTGLTWPNALGSKRIGVALGNRERATGIKRAGGAGAGAPAVGPDNADGFTWEAYYEYKLNDHTTITPALFGGSSVYDGSQDDIFGALVQTVFKF